MVRSLLPPPPCWSPGLQRLLEVRRVVNLRNPAHSLIKLMTEESYGELKRRTVENAVDVAAGRTPRNIVNPEVLGAPGAQPRPDRRGGPLMATHRERRASASFPH